MQFLGIFVAICVVTAISAESLPKPERIRVSQRTETSFRVDWQQPPSQRYTRFAVKISPDAVISESADLSEMSRTFSDMEVGQRYSVFIQGFTPEGEASSVLKHNVWTAPDEPSNLRMSAVQEIAISISIMGVKTKFTAFVDGMQVEWDDVSQEQIISGYDLQITPNEGVIVESDDEEFSGTVKKIVTGLTPGKEYSVSLRARVGPDFDPVYSKPVTSKMRMPPAVPHLVEVTESEPTSVVLKTHGPLEGIHDDLDFQLTPRHGSIGKPTPDVNYPMFDLYPWQGLKPGTTYTLDVYAVSENVIGYKPKTITFSTAPAPPLRIRVDNYDHYSVTLRWAHAHKFTNVDEVQYIIEFLDLPDGKLQFAVVKDFKLDSQVVVQVQELIPGTVYEFRVYTVLNGVKGVVPAKVIQTTIPLKPRTTSRVFGRKDGVTVVFGLPVEGDCPVVKTFYSPGLDDESVPPTFHSLGEEVTYEEMPTDGRYSLHARCVSMNVEGPELVIMPSGPDGLEDNTKNDSKDATKHDKEPTKPKGPLPCPSRIGGSASHLIPKPDMVAPDACCHKRPYHTAEKECCGESLLDKEGERLCCNNESYNKRFSVCCGEGDLKFVFSRRDGCPIVPSPVE